MRCATAPRRWRDALRQLRSDGVRSACVVLPLYPQYSTTTTASVADVLRPSAVAGALQPRA